MSEINALPSPDRALDGSELVPLFQDLLARQVPLAQIVGMASATLSALDSDVSAKAAAAAGSAAAAKANSDGAVAAALASAASAASAAGSASTFTTRSLRAPAGEALNDLPPAAARIGGQLTFDAHGQSQVSQRPFLSITDPEFGAVGDGVLSANETLISGTDDTAAIQACINAVIALGGGTVYFPKGKVYCVKRLTAQPARHLIFDGPGARLVQISTGLTNNNLNPKAPLASAMLHLLPAGYTTTGAQEQTGYPASSRVVDVIVRNLRFIGHYPSPPPPYSGPNTYLTGQIYDEFAQGVIAFGSDGVLFDNITMTNMGAENIYIGGRGVARDCSITKGHETFLGKDGRIEGGEFSFAYAGNGVGAGIVDGASIHDMPAIGTSIGGSSSTGIKRSSVIGCIFFNCPSGAILGGADGDPTTVQFAEISGNLITACGTSLGGASISYDSQNASNIALIANNICDGASGNGISISGKGTFKLKGNLTRAGATGEKYWGIQTGSLNASAVAIIDGNTNLGWVNRGPLNTTSPARLVLGQNFDDVSGSIAGGGRTMGSVAYDPVVLAYGANVAPSTLSRSQRLSITSATPFAIASAIPLYDEQIISLSITNATAAAHGAITFATGSGGYRTNGSVAVGAGLTQTLTFVSENGAWREIGRSAAL